MSGHVVQREQSDVRAIDKGLRNCWKWEWLEKVVNNEPISKYIRKLNLKGIALCQLCNKQISYAGRGWKSLEQHLTKKIHRDNVRIQESNYRLSSKLLNYVTVNK
jgi:hypothetical protein